MYNVLLVFRHIASRECGFGRGINTRDKFCSRWTFGEHTIYVKLLDGNTGFATRTVDTITVFIEISLKPPATSQYSEAGTVYAENRIPWLKLLTYGLLPCPHLRGWDLLAHPNQYVQIDHRLLLHPGQGVCVY